MKNRAGLKPAHRKLPFIDYCAHMLAIQGCMNMLGMVKSINNLKLGETFCILEHGEYGPFNNKVVKVKIEQLLG